MKVRFQADADLHQMIVTALVRREPGVDFQTATAAGLEGLLDPQVLERAATEGRMLVSHDQSTMPPVWMGLHLQTSIMWMGSHLQTSISERARWPRLKIEDVTPIPLFPQFQRVLMRFHNSPDRVVLRNRRVQA
jgi:hypothetical protein